MSKQEPRSFLASSFTDLMASLAVIFILLTVIFLKNASEKSRTGKDVIREGLAQVLEKNKLPLEQDPNDPLTLTVRVGEGNLKFAVNSSVVSSAGVEFLSAFAPSFAKELCSESVISKVDSVIIEGHTDKTGESGDGGTNHNIKLSQERAFSVLSYLLANVRKYPDLSECFLKLVSASGRGSRNPFVSDGKYNPHLSRRVEIKIRVKSSEQSFFSKYQ